MQGLGTDEESLIEILCSRSNAELVEIKQVYKECKCEKVQSQLLITDKRGRQQVRVRVYVFVCAVFKKDLEKDVAGDTSGDFAKLLLALVAVRSCLYSVHQETLSS